MWCFFFGGGVIFLRLVLPMRWPAFYRFVRRPYAPGLFVSWRAGLFGASSTRLLSAAFLTPFMKSPMLPAPPY